MDVGINSLSVILNAAKYGKFTSLTEKDIFKMEYWPLELAKIKSSSLRLKGSVTVITGGLGSLGYATAQKFKKEGSEVAIIDIVNPKKAYLTHISHMLGFHNDVEKKLPANVFLAYDGLEITI